MERVTIYQIGEAVNMRMEDGEFIEGTLTDVMRLTREGAGLVMISGMTYFSHRIPGVKIGEGENSVTYTQENGRRSKE